MDKRIRIIICTLMITVIVFSLGSCSVFPFRNVSQCDSLQEYKDDIEPNGIASYSDNINVKNFLPSQTFLSDFEYLKGDFHFYSEKVFNWMFFDKSSSSPIKAILSLKYSGEVYESAKAEVISKIPSANDSIYKYGDYTFYENGNFSANEDKVSFPKKFNMVCYNDTNKTIIFLSFFSYIDNEQEKEQIISNWSEFIDIHYGEYYDFSK